MSTEDVLKFIQENKSKFSTVGLVAELKKQGFSDDDIQDAIKQDARARAMSGPKTAASEAVVAGTMTSFGKMWRYILGFVIGLGLSSGIAGAAAILLYRLGLPYLNWTFLPEQYHDVPEILVALTCGMLVNVLLLSKIRHHSGYIARGITMGVYVFLLCTITWYVKLKFIL